MINDLLNRMSRDMEIYHFRNEPEDSFIYRLCYSALGYWCLHTALNKLSGDSGTTKNNQTIILKDLLSRYIELFPSISDRFINNNNQQITFPLHIRNIYEETGYLLTDDNNRNQVANYRRSIPIGNAALFFGLPNITYSINGLGVFGKATTYIVSTKEFLIRDDLTYEEYFQSQFDPIDFYNRDIDINELEFFNPKLNNSPSQSWRKELQVDCTLARQSENGPFYRIMQTEDNILFAEEPVEPQKESFTSYEYRRLLFALKAHYGRPLKVYITQKDDEYSEIRLKGHLPNREYYYLLLLSWPVQNAFDKINFLIRTGLLQEVKTTLENIGLEINGGQTNA